jgi:hypothetical protein
MGAARGRCAGFGLGHRLRAVGDGAPWIASQADACLGAQGSYWVDFLQLLNNPLQPLPNAPDLWHSITPQKKFPPFPEAPVDEQTPCVVSLLGIIEKLREAVQRQEEETGHLNRHSAPASSNYLIFRD